MEGIFQTKQPFRQPNAHLCSISFSFFPQHTCGKDSLCARVYVSMCWHVCVTPGWHAVCSPQWPLGSGGQTASLCVRQPGLQKIDGRLIGRVAVSLSAVCSSAPANQSGPGLTRPVWVCIDQAVVEGPAEGIVFHSKVCSNLPSDVLRDLSV